MYSNFHTHCFYCDGIGHPEDYVQKAITLGFRAIGFSCHAPLPFSNPWTMTDEVVMDYCNSIFDLKQKYKGRIEVYLGLEIDYFKDLSGPGSINYKSLNLDYTIGSIHFMKDYPTGSLIAIDGSEEEYLFLLNNSFGGNIRKFIGNYYTNMREMIKEHRPTIVGHIDSIKRNNSDYKYYAETENWYKNEVTATLQILAETRTILEVSTVGLSRGYTNSLYPSDWILTEAKKMDIPIILNSDAHNVNNLNSEFEHAVKVLSKCGYSKQTILSQDKWILVDLT